MGTWVRIPPSPPENGAMSRFIGIAPLFIVLTPTAFFLALPPAFGQFLGQRQGLFHCGGAQLLRLGIQMGVDVGRGGDVAVAQPFLNLLHGHPLFQQQAGTGVAQIVEADMSQTMCFQELSKILGNCIGKNEISHLIYE